MTIARLVVVAMRSGAAVLSCVVEVCYWNRSQLLLLASYILLYVFEIVSPP